LAKEVWNLEVFKEALGKKAEKEGPGGKIRGCKRGSSGHEISKGLPRRV